VRLFIGRLSPVPIVVTMAFFEGFIQRFMPYLADLARRQGSSELEYRDVHGVCDALERRDDDNGRAAVDRVENDSSDIAHPVGRRERGAAELQNSHRTGIVFPA
jgi:hypothetical protein